MHTPAKHKKVDLSIKEHKIHKCHYKAVVLQAVQECEVRQPMWCYHHLLGNSESLKPWAITHSHKAGSHATPDCTY